MVGCKLQGRLEIFGGGRRMIADMFELGRFKIGHGRSLGVAFAFDGPQRGQVNLSVVHHAPRDVAGHAQTHARARQIRRRDGRGGNIGDGSGVYSFNQRFGNGEGVFADRIFHPSVAFSHRIGDDAVTVFQPDDVGRNGTAQRSQTKECDAVSQSQKL